MSVFDPLVPAPPNEFLAPNVPVASRVGVVEASGVFAVAIQFMTDGFPATSFVIDASHARVMARRLVEVAERVELYAAGGATNRPLS